MVGGSWGPFPVENTQKLERPFKVTVSFTHTCNLDCKLCYADCGRAAGRTELAGTEWRRLISEWAEGGIVALLVEGGEPLFREDCLDVLAHASPLMLTRLRTHGTLVTSTLARRIVEAGVATVLVDLWGATAATHDELVGVTGAFDRTIAGIGHLLEVGLETQLLFIMNRYNVGELQAWTDLAAGLGVRTIGVLRPYPIGRARRLWDEISLPLPTMMEALAGLRLPPRLTLMQSWHPNDGNCCWQMAAVNAWGDSIGCTYLREFVNYGNLAETTLFDTWNHPRCRELRSGRVETSCTNCSRTQGSHGGCRSTAYAFHGRWSAPDPFDAPLNAGVDLRELPQWMRLGSNPRPPDSSGS
jgi:radical SAM protein with 4Fe4S-binding SPASM domain